LRKQILSLIAVAACQIGLLQAQSTLHYPGRYMGREEVKTNTAPNGAVADAGFAQTLQLIYPQPTIVNEVLQAAKQSFSKRELD
jgi:hypothetical protein